MRAWALAIGCALLGACGDGSAGAGTEATGVSSGEVVDPTGGELVPLVLPTLWKPVPAAMDPLAQHRPTQVQCPLGGWLFEPQGLEIDTLLCNYAMFSQPSRAAIVKGARIVASIYHFDLVADEAATAHVALLVGDNVVWEQEVAIPGKANAYPIDVPASFAADAGTPVSFHLHNHGQNTWTLGEIQVEVFAD